jgi:adenylate cyclase class 2
VIEAEIKARLVDPDAVRTRLQTRATGTPETYADTYYDSPDHALSASDRELRIRTITGASHTRHVLTFKGRPVDAATQSKPETEITVSSADATESILTALGYVPKLSFTKQCINYQLDHEGRHFLATLVTVPEIDGDFLEVETPSAEDDVDQALAAVRHLLGDLGVYETEWTTDTYTDAVRAARLTNMTR